MSKWSIIFGIGVKRFFTAANCKLIYIAPLIFLLSLNTF